MQRPGFLGKKIFRHGLRWLYGFDRWHISVLEERPYARDIIAHCNNRKKRDSYVEIGCGLGDILFNVDFSSRCGYDSDPGAVRAGRLLAKLKRKRATFREFNFPQSPLHDHADVMAMVNWIHHIEPGVLKSYLVRYLNENINNGGELIIDTVQDKEYPVNHNIEYLMAGERFRVEKIGDYARQREVWAIYK